MNAQPLEILRARARALARPRARPAEAEDALELLAFTVAGETYGVELMEVSEVVALRMLVALPGAPSAVRGVVSLRGRIVAVVDLRKLLGLPERGISDLNKLVVLGGAGIVLAVLADAIHGVRRLPLSAMQPSPADGPGSGTDYVRGVSADRMVVLAAQRLLSSPQLHSQHRT